MPTRFSIIQMKFWLFTKIVLFYSFTFKMKCQYGLYQGIEKNAGPNSLSIGHFTSSKLFLTTYFLPHLKNV